MLNPQAVCVQPVRSLSFGLYILVVSLLFGLIGILFGLAGLFGSLVGMHVFFQFGSWGINSVAAGFAGLIIMPALFSLSGLLLSLITFRPVNWVIRRL